MEYCLADQLTGGVPWSGVVLARGPFVVKNAELGTAVLLPALRNPVVLAQQIATLDQISQGRYILGVGIASDVPNIRAEFTAAGVPFEKRVGRMLEGLRLCRELWTGKPVNWNSRWVMENSVLGPTPHRPGGPPIWIGGMVRPARDRSSSIVSVRYTAPVSCEGSRPTSRAIWWISSHCARQRCGSGEFGNQPS